MSPDLCARLRESAPTFFGGGEPGNPFAERGFECGDGWFDILLELGASCESHGARTLQVKEKFGTLRVYVEGSCPEVDRAVCVAETKSGSVCETCGGPGEARETRYGWRYVGCPSHVRI